MRHIFLTAAGLLAATVTCALAQPSSPVLTLQDCIWLAESAPSAVSVARQERVIAARGVTQARAGFLPQSSLVNGFVYNSPLRNDRKAFSFVPLNGIREYLSLVTISQEFDTSGRLRADMARAGAGPIRDGAVCSLTPADRPKAKFWGRISVVNQAVDPARRTVEVWCEVPNENRDLRAGGFGTLEVLTHLLKDVVVVPVAAVQADEGGRKGIVMVVDSRRKAARREVAIGATAGGRVAISQGLQPGETVTVEGGYGLPEGTEVKWP